MKERTLKIHSDDNVVVALDHLIPGEELRLEETSVFVKEDIPAKHKFFLQDLSADAPIFMYGVLVGRTMHPVGSGTRMTTTNTRHEAGRYEIRAARKTHWQPPDISAFQNRTFMGFHRADGRVGTANYWLMVPLVFCENRNLDELRNAFLGNLGYARPSTYAVYVRQLAEAYQNDESVIDLPMSIPGSETTGKGERVFPNVDGIRFLKHEGGCGGTRDDARALCALLAGYITHPNTGGATVLSLGCQHAQIEMLREEIQKRDPSFDKPLVILEQQQSGTETKMMESAIRETFRGLVTINQSSRSSQPLSKLCIGLECGGSDGFSGISANPAVGHASDILVALGGSVILSEFPELCGVEQELSDRCTDLPTAQRFSHLMQSYQERALAVGSGFDMNPSPGNIRDGLITDAIKSAGAAKKGGSSPVTAVLDYTEPVSKSGLNLLCTPGNDVESTTAEVASGANIVLFTTGLGTPTGNPIAPVVKISSNTALAARMPDIIDLDTGSIIDGLETIQEAGERIVEYIIRVASGETEVAASRLQQYDFIPWKRGVSL